jgi:multimeric flavodoxin WrbA
MSVKVLGISTSPRLKGNSDLLLREALNGAESAGAAVEYIRLCDLNISPCVECNSCYKTGKCQIEDDYQMVLAKLLEADRLIFATPIFFMSVCAQAKILIDRCQCLWAHKYVLKKPLITSCGRDRRAIVIAVGGTKSKKMFDSVRLTMKYYFDVLDMCYAANLFINKVDDCCEIKKHPLAMKEAYRLGAELISITTPPPEKPIDVELT